MSSTTCLPKGKGDSSMKALPFRRSSVISVDYDSSVFEDSDCMINVQTPGISWRPSTQENPIFTGDKKKASTTGRSNCDSPSNYGIFKKQIGDVAQSNRFFSPKSPAAAVQMTGESSTQASVAQAPAVTEPDDFFIDDFDIDDISDSDIPDYFDEPLSSSASRQEALQCCH